MSILRIFAALKAIRERTKFDERITRRTRSKIEFHAPNRSNYSSNRLNRSSVAPSVPCGKNVFGWQRTEEWRLHNGAFAASSKCLMMALPFFGLMQQWPPMQGRLDYNITSDGMAGGGLAVHDGEARAAFGRKRE